MRMVRRYLYLKPNEEINTMSKIVTQDKLNELTGMSIDYGKGGGIVLTTKPQLVSGVAQLRLVTTSQINQLKKKIQLQTKTYSLLMRRQVVYTLLAVVPMLKFQLQTAMRILYTQLEEVKQLVRMELKDSYCRIQLLHLTKVIKYLTCLTILDK